MPPLPHPSDFAHAGIQHLGNPSFNFIIYCIAAALHIVFSCFFTYQLWAGIRKLSPIPRFKIKKRIMYASISIYGFFLVIASICEAKLVLYSHQRTLEILRIVRWDGFLLPEIPFTSISWFSLFVLGLIQCGIVFSVVACIWSAVKSADITLNQVEKAEFDRDAIWSDVSMFGIIVASVFLTSTIATTFYLSIGRNFTEPDGYGQFYSSSGDAMSVLWAACFSVIMIIIVLFPTIKMNELARAAHRKQRVLGKDTERFQFIYTALSTERVVRMIMVLAAPIYIAAFRVAFS